MEMQLVSGAALPYPGSCRGCGSATRDCIDLGFDIDDDPTAVEDRLIGRNAALLCVECFRQCAKLMDFVPATNRVVLIPSGEYEEILRKARLAANELTDILNITVDLDNPQLDYDSASSVESETEKFTTDLHFRQDDSLVSFQRSDDVSSDSSNESDPEPSDDELFGDGSELSRLFSS
jgi:hypothetical protein